MPSATLATYLRDQLADLKAKGLYKAERRIESPQRAEITVGGKRVINDQNFRGAKYDAVFGGFEIDLRRANILEDEAVLDLNAVFGGIEVRVPESWSVVVKGAGVFGAFQDSTHQPDPRIYPAPKRLIVRGGAVFGGVELKN